jgi:hypothetical protein
MSSGFSPSPLPEIPVPHDHSAQTEKEPAEIAPHPIAEVEPDETSPEETPVSDLVTQIEETPLPVPKKIPPQKTLPQQHSDPIIKLVESIMAEGFEDVYRELSVREQQAFRLEGEKTAHTIRELLRETK